MSVDELLKTQNQGLRIRQIQGLRAADGIHDQQLDVNCPDRRDQGNRMETSRLPFFPKLERT